MISLMAPLPGLGLPAAQSGRSAVRFGARAAPAPAPKRSPSVLRRGATELLAPARVRWLQAARPVSLLTDPSLAWWRALQRSKHPKMQRIPGDEVQNRLAAIMNRDGAAYDFAFVRIGPGKYWWGRRRVIVKIVNDQIVVLLGGGYMTLKKFLRLYGTASDAGQEAVAAFHGAGALCTSPAAARARSVLTGEPPCSARVRGG